MTAAPESPQRSLTALIAFLLDRVEEDEKELSRAARNTGQPRPARASAECLAKRKIIGSVQRLSLLRDLPSERSVRDQARHILRAMALPYADHPGFRPEWR